MMSYPSILIIKPILITPSSPTIPHTHIWWSMKRYTNLTCVLMCVIARTARDMW